MKTWKRRLLRGAIGFILLLAGAVCVLWLSLRGSLPPLDGQEPADVGAPVTLERDATGIVTIRTKDEGDLYFGLGYAHGQDRFFSMDLQRRVAAGELSELFGKETLEHDRFIRLLGIQAHVRSVLNQLGDPERLKLARYTAGVNAGLASLSVRPFPYLLLRMPPREWVEEDCLFVAMSMYVSLQDFTGDSQLIEQAVHNRLGPDIWAFLYRNGHAGSRPLNEDPIPILAPPDEGWLPGPGEEPSTEAPDDQTPGSNAFAVGSRLTDDGRAILAVDMHLSLSVPNVWYRARLIIDDQLDAVGASLPGVPGLSVGTNGKVAWGFTYSAIDTFDLVDLRKTGPRPEENTFSGEIAIRGEKPETYERRSYRGFPVVDKFGHDWLVQSTAFHPDFLNLKLLEMLNAATLEEAVAIAHTAGMPTMNLILVDSEGNIGWTLMGGIPQRPLPASQRLMNHEEPWEWSGRVPARQTPRLINPGGGRIWSTNNRILGRQLVDLLGDGGYPYNGRDTVIHEKLHAADRFNETALLDIQLSAQTSVFDRWRAWLTQLETEGRWTPGQLPYPELWEDVLQNDGRALPESRGYFFLRRFRYQLAESVFNRLLGGINLKWTTLGFRWDEPLYQILTTSAGQQLDPEGSDWMNSLDEAFEETVNWLNSEYGSVERARWGARNQLRLKHPLSRALPVLSPLLDMPTREVPGDSYAPRVQGTAFGASQRMVVSPEHPEDGIFHMPTGQSGHFLSPFYRAGHTDWLEGRPSPLLPGTARHRRTLVPGHPPDGPVSGNP